ncbi:MAG TPA: vanadium-dependent haloperoxidase [Pyrinomonadaceae bacterium]|jgi:membrane-associated phospholipid phosphatase|nr:vanadium-dependent haloperoxidase [Pyrinomonadaceae bacterium]
MMRKDPDTLSALSLPASRRRFLSRISQATIATVAASALLPSLHSVRAANPGQSKTSEPTRTDDNQRRNRAYQIRQQAALYQKNLPLAPHPINGDEERYTNRIGSYSKALPHNSLGEVNAAAYGALIKALASGTPSDFETIPLGGVVKQANPQAAFAYELEGSDSHCLAIGAPPSFSSAELAGEMVELYWQALTRDVPFSDYNTDALINDAAVELSKLSDFRGPKTGGQVTTETIFRGRTAGDLAGPYVSQFLWKDFLYGATPLSQLIRTTAPGREYLTTYSAWLAVQNGAAAAATASQFDSTPRYIRNGRDLAEYVHRDFSYQAFLNAALILFGMRAPLDSASPYSRSKSQSGFSTFGSPHVLDLLARVANSALKAAWYQKWSVHRHLRPEEFGGRVHNHKTGAARYPLHAEVLGSVALNRVYGKYGSYLLPMAYPEGAPTHPSYPSGHAAVAGACTTVLKAFFDESFVIANPVEATPDGLMLIPYAGQQLTVGGELNKLASNIAIGRNTAGVHWRSDAIEGLALGEAVAIGILTDMRGCFNEKFDGFSLSRFDGTTITV